MVVPVHTVKACRISTGMRHSFLTSALKGGVWSNTHTPVTILPGEECLILIKQETGQADLDILEKRNVQCPQPGLYTDYTFSVISRQDEFINVDVFSFVLFKYVKSILIFFCLPHHVLQSEMEMSKNSHMCLQFLSTYFELFCVLESFSCIIVCIQSSRVSTLI